MENKVEFNEITDKSKIAVTHPETKKVMAEITGYDLDIKFNMELINTEDDVEGVATGLADAFKEALINKLISKT